MKEIFKPGGLKDPFRRRVVYAARGMVATSQPLAAQAGLEILRMGGNAVDAAVAAAAVLTVVEPTSNGIGGDNFALVWTGGKLHAMNASGRAPGSLSIEALKERGYREIPKEGVVPVTVPGTPGGWVALNESFGRLSLEEVMQPAIGYALGGFGVSATVAHLWHKAFEGYRERKGEGVYKPWFDTFAPGGRPPGEGDRVVLEDHGRTLSEIASTKGRSFYQGALARKIAGFITDHQGFLTLEDLRDFRVQWVNPLRVDYRGFDIWEIPPNGQGIVALMALNILKGEVFHQEEKIATLHRQIEAMKLAFADGRKFIAEPGAMTVSAGNLLAESYGRERRRLIGQRAKIPGAGRPPGGGTVYLATADEAGKSRERG